MSRPGRQPEVPGVTGKSRLSGRVRRSLANNPRIRQGILGELDAVFDPIIPFSKKPNTAYGPGDCHMIMIAAAALGVSVFGYASAARKHKTRSFGLGKSHRMCPSGEWICNLLSRIDPHSLMRSFGESVSGHLDRLQKLGLLRGKQMDVAIDMHLIRRWDKKHGAEVVRPKSKNKTGLYERYIAAQCINANVQLALASLHMPALEDAADYTRRVVELCSDNGIKIELAMLDREFFSTDVIRALDEMNVGYLMPCRNTANVIKAIGEFANGERPAVSESRIAKSKNDSAGYTMIITERKRKSRRKGKGSDKEKPEEKYIAFATNRPKKDIERYSERWTIETGFRMVENERVRTRSRSPTIRTFCFLYSLVLFNAWVLANAELTCNPLLLGGVYSRITQTDMKVIMLMEVFHWYGERGKPPPDGRCHLCTEAACPGISGIRPLPQ